MEGGPRNKPPGFLRGLLRYIVNCSFLYDNHNCIFCMHACMHACRQAGKHAHTHARTHARTNARTHTLTRTHARTHARTHTHKSVYMPWTSATYLSPLLSCRRLLTHQAVVPVDIYPGWFAYECATTGDDNATTLIISKYSHIYDTIRMPLLDSFDRTDAYTRLL